MSAMKAFAEDVSVEMGFGGELTDEVLEEANKRLQEDEKYIKALDILRLLRQRQNSEENGDFAGLRDIREKLLFLLTPDNPSSPN